MLKVNAVNIRYPATDSNTLTKLTENLFKNQTEHYTKKY